jgi:molybdopterin-containing oxidoreductase family iron-sulfur binding subunit
MSSLTDNTPAGRKKLWRSFDELADNAIFRRHRDNEFPHGVDDLPEVAEGMSRRGFVSAVGATAALAGLTSCRRPEEKIIPYVRQPEDVVPGIPQYYATTMPVGTDCYGVVCETHEGRPTKLEGNELHPTTKGRSNVRIQAEMLTMYDPHRSTGPSKDGSAVVGSEFTDAFGALIKDKLAAQGKGLAIISEAFSSPSTAAAVAAARKAMPQASWVAWEPVNNANRAAGLLAATGSAVQPVYDLTKAKVVVSLDADFLTEESDNVANCAAFAAHRSKLTNMNRLYVAEANLSNTGATADHRVRLRASAVPALAAELAAAVGVKDIKAAGESGADASWLEAVAADLKANRGSAVVIAGRRQPAGVHAAAAAINLALGAVGNAVSFSPTTDVEEVNAAGLSAITEGLNGGTIDTVVVIGANPVFNAPADLNFPAAYGKAATTVHFGLFPDETAVASKWHAPLAHFLESWGDARSSDGTLSIIQPMIKPLFSGRSILEVASWIATGEEDSGYEIVRTRWKSKAATDTAWRRVLHDGLLPNSSETVSVETVKIAEVNRLLGEAKQSGGTEIVFTACPKIHDGRYVSNGWLQELPHQATKVTWSNAAIIGTEKADELGVPRGNVGQLVTLTTKAGSVTLPAIVVPGIAPDTIVVEYGYGRNFGAQINGKEGGKVGHDVFPLRSVASGLDAAEGQVVVASGSGQLSTTQNYHAMIAPQHRNWAPTEKPRPLIREATLGDYEAEGPMAISPDLFGYDKEKGKYKPALESLWKDDFIKDEGYEEGKRNFPRWDKEKFPQWGMAIDLNICTGCNACTMACQAENNLPVVGPKEAGYGREMHWIRIDRYYAGAKASTSWSTTAVSVRATARTTARTRCVASTSSITPTTSLKLNGLVRIPTSPSAFAA